jgi:universal stress protein A
MQIYQHILFAAGLLDENHTVEKKVAEIQRLTNARLSIIHVIEPLPPAYIGGEAGVIPEYVDIDEALTRNALASLNKISERLNIPQTSLATATGSVSHEILQYAEEKAVDLIVVGSHGRHGLQLLLGSTANAILHHANCDVLSVRLKDS